MAILSRSFPPQCCYCAELVVFLDMLPLYEFAITFDQEIAAVWNREKKLSAGSFLLVSTRWCMVLSAVLALLPGNMTVRDSLSCYCEGILIT